MYKTEDYNYYLPEDLVAQTPMEPRDHSKLMLIETGKGRISHHHFYDLPNLLSENDQLVMNDTKVIKARLLANRSTGGRVEIFLSQPLAPDRWMALLKPAKKIQEGETLFVSEGFSVKVLKKHLKPGLHEIFLESDGDVHEAIETFGNTPLPPYIDASKPEAANQFTKRYQTIVAKTPGAVAAPTAGLHFTDNTLQALSDKGIPLQTITLHVGLGTFQPISNDDVTQHNMHEESYYLDDQAADSLLAHKQNKGSIVAVGTTVTRTLESAAAIPQLHRGWQTTDHYIYPGYKFRFIDKLLTNFHLPKSSLIVLVSALAGYDLTMQAYDEAIKHRYRFYSFGDAMLIVP